MDTARTYIKQLFAEKDIQALFIASPTQIAYLTNYHGFSLVEREAYLLITKDKQYVFTDSRYTEEVQSVTKNLTVLERSSQKPTAALLKEVLENHSIKRLGFEPDVMTVAEYKQLKPKSVTFVPISLRSLRMKKTSAEIENITKACEIGDKTFSYIQTQIKEGMTEKEVAKLMEIFIRNQDAPLRGSKYPWGANLSFETIVAFGKNAAIPHHHTNGTKLKSGDCILLDFGVKYHNYCSDMTRTIFFKKVTDEQKHIYNTVLTAQQKAVEFIENQLRNSLHPNLLPQEKETKKKLPLPSGEGRGEGTQATNLSAVDQAARSYITSQNYPSIPHSLGHGIGLEVHEAPSLSPHSKDELQEGMVFSIEPGIYLSQKNIGVRIEDLFTIQKGKLIQLTKSSKEILAI